MEQDKKNKFSIKELSLENLHLARESLVKKGEMHLINLLDSCYTGDLSDAEDFKELCDRVNEYIEYIDYTIEKMKYPGNKNIKM